MEHRRQQTYQREQAEIAQTRYKEKGVEGGKIDNENVRRLIDKMWENKREMIGYG